MFMGLYTKAEKEAAFKRGVKKGRKTKVRGRRKRSYGSKRGYGRRYRRGRY